MERYYLNEQCNRWIDVAKGERGQVDFITNECIGLLNRVAIVIIGQVRVIITWP